MQFVLSFLTLIFYNKKKIELKTLLDKNKLTRKENPLKIKQRINLI